MVIYIFQSILSKGNNQPGHKKTVAVNVNRYCMGTNLKIITVSTISQIKEAEINKTPSKVLNSCTIRYSKGREGVTKNRA